MAFPVDQARAVTNSTTSSTSHSLNLPASIASGDYLLAVVRCPGSTTISWPAGWTEHEQSSGDPTDDEVSLAYRVADGSEGATITITLGTARVLVGLCYRITGAHASGLAISAIAVSSGSSQPDTANLALPTAARDILWISIGGNEDVRTISSAPTSYGSSVIQASTATGTSGCSVWGASRQLNAASENPGAWTLSANTQWIGWTVGFSDAGFPARVTQIPVETLVQPTDAKARVTQIPVEALIENAAPYVPQIAWRS